MQLSHHIVSANIAAPMTIAHVSDLHEKPFKRVLAALQKATPELIAITGDLFDYLDEAPQALPFLLACASLAPTVYVYGNHERTTVQEDDAVRATGVTLLQDEAARIGELTVGGLCSGFRGHKRQGNLTATPTPDTTFLTRFAAMEGFKLLLCHHPEYYPLYIRDLPIDLTLAGHAHGGQWRIGKRGIFAPGQGFFPTYTSGMYEGRLIVSRGLSNTAPIPRLANPTELVFVHLQPT